MEDAATIVSVYPLRFFEQKSGHFPSTYSIPGAAKGDCEILVIGSVTTWEYIDEQRGSRPTVIPPLQFGAALLMDAINTFPEYNENAKPGLFVVSGAYTKDEIKKRFFKQLDDARLTQDKWMAKLIEIADDDWKENQKLSNITQLQREAANYLGLKRDWNLDLGREGTKECPACISIIPARALICKFCQTRLDVKGNIATLGGVALQPQALAEATK